ncbi:MAG: sensor histidine kinase [Pseudomonadota bacterium]|nr:histidine kinase [Pseudomonadales bacterium]MDY6920831.1 sensor histidine kinase [Pseudomonadota bacterium]
MVSLQTQIKRYSALIYVVAVSGVLLISDYAVRTIVIQYVNTRLQHDAESLAAHLQWNRSEGSWALDAGAMATIYDRVFSGHYYAVFDADRMLRSRSWWDYSPPLEPVTVGSARQMTRTGPNDQQWLVHAEGIQLRDRALTVWVAEDITPVMASLNRFRGVVLFTLALSLLFLLWLQQRLLRHVFARLEPIRDQLQRMRLGQETPAWHRQMPTEVAPLLAEIERLLAQLAQRVSRSRHALGNLAHELKRPLQNLRLNLESPDPVNPEEQIELIDELQHKLERELKRARIVGASSPGRQTRLQQELPPLAEVLQRLYPDCAINLDYPEALILPQDRDDMIELLGNLLDNACRYGARQIELRVTVDPSGYHLEIRDDGPGIPHQQLDALKQRGQRLDEGASGSGLGLAICQDIVDSYQGRLQLRNGPTGGLEVVVDLPLGTAT